jgi:hypothetical protein
MRLWFRVSKTKVDIEGKRRIQNLKVGKKIKGVLNDKVNDYRRLELSNRFGGVDWHGRTSRETISFWRIALTVFPYLLKQKAEPYNLGSA